MTALSKRGWSPGISVDDEISVFIQWLSKARQKNILGHRPPSLYTAYICPSIDSVSFMTDVSSLFKWSMKDTPETDLARDCILRMLAVLIKAHFFMAKSDRSKHEPYFFTFPDIGKPDRNRFGLMMRLEESKKSIVVAEGDMGLMSSAKVLSGRFPVVVGSNSFRWVDVKHWRDLAEKADMLQKILRPWEGKKEREAVEGWKTPHDFPFGTLFDVPFHLREDAKAVGMLWAAGIKKWYLPHGFDVDPVIEYMKHVESITDVQEDKASGQQPRGRQEFRAVALHELQEKR